MFSLPERSALNDQNSPNMCGYKPRSCWKLIFITTPERCEIRTARLCVYQNIPQHPVRPVESVEVIQFDKDTYHLVTTDVDETTSGAIRITKKRLRCDRRLAVQWSENRANQPWTGGRMQRRR